MRHVQRDVLQVVYAGAADGDVVVHGVAGVVPAIGALAGVRMRAAIF
jgi:hypothetical protein